MTKEEFVSTLKEKLVGLPSEEIDDRISFYLEIISDKIEEGVKEEDAISQLGSVNKIAAQIIGEIPLTAIAKHKFKEKGKLSPLSITLIALGSPILFSLIVSAFAILFSLYVSAWAVTACLWALPISFGASFLGGTIYAVVILVSGKFGAFLSLFGVSIVCLGLCILSLPLCKYATKGAAILTKLIFIGTKKCFIGKEKK